MSKIRINDLARELEVKSREILDSLTVVGVTEKKTHSSSLEDHEADLVRKHLRGRYDASPSSSKTSRAAQGEDGIKTKIDLSNISRPGDVLRAIQQKSAAEQPAARPVAKPPAATPAVEAKADAQAPAASAPSSAASPMAPKAIPPKSVPASEPPAAPPAPRMVTPASVAATFRPPSVVVIPPKAPVAPPAATTPAAPSSTTSAPAAIAVPPRAATPATPVGVVPPAAQPPASNVAQMQSPVQSQSPMPVKPSGPIVPLPRMIMPQTGPRPVYKAPLPPPPAPGAISRPHPDAPCPASQFFSAPHVPKLRAQRVRRCVLAKDVRCIRRASLPQDRVRLAWAPAQVWRPRDQCVRELVLARHLAAPAKDMFREE